MSEQIRIRRHSIAAHFTIVPNEVAQNSDLSWGARGLLVYLLSLPADWSIRVTEVQGHGTDGRRRFYSLKRELESAGYVRGYRTRDQKGVITGVCWEVSDRAWAWDEAREPDAESEVDHKTQSGRPLGDFLDDGKTQSGRPLSKNASDGNAEDAIAEDANAPTTKKQLTKNTSTKDGGNGDPAVSPVSLQTWDSMAARYQRMPWEDQAKRLDEEFVAHLTRLWTTADRDAVKAGLMARQFLRKARSSEDAYLRATDAWELYQASRQEQEQQEAARAADETARAERDFWLKQGY